MARRLISLVILSALAIVGMPLAAGSLASAQDAPPPDGLSSFTAAASCWEIAQNDPDADDGVYWLVTPTLQAPEQFYCDMTTEGGGWVLVGRGRQGWQTFYQGHGTTAQVREVVDGPDAFVPRQLHSEVIDGLLDGGRVDALTDGIRVRRARSADGSVWQEARIRLQNRDRWVWTFPAEHRIAQWSFNAWASNNGTGGQTMNFGSDNAFNRIDTRASSAQGWTHGWSYGSQVTGTNSANSYLWSQTDGGNFARPFSQVWLRPQLRLADLDFGTIPDSGTEAQEQHPLLENHAIPGEWGVTGQANGVNTELTTEVSAFAQIGTRVYVGGNFRWAQRGANATGADQVEQPYLAAFDVNTGAWISEFRPVLDNQVKALAALPDGTLMVGGEFTVANGAPALGTVRLDPATGATAPGWQLALENRLSGGSPVNVRALTVHDDWLYLGGFFTHTGSSERSWAVYTRMGARVDVTTGLPDGGWNPNLNGSVIAMDASADGTRVYASGYFTQANGQPAPRAAALDTVTGAATPWTPTWSASASYQQAILEVGERLWVGGSEHSLFSYDTGTLERLSGNITKQGGDFQTIGTAHGVVYGSCHCNEWNYSNAFTWSNVGADWTQADRIGFTGAWDAETGEVLPEFNPKMTARRGSGPWATFTDSLGNVWLGGDMNQAEQANGAMGWVGGFVRYAPRDTAAPGTPGDARVDAIDADSTTIAWNGSNGAPARYEILLEDRVVATTTQTSFTMPTPENPVRVFVRAIDAAGNRSASTPVVEVVPPVEPPPDASVTLIERGADWNWRYASGAWPTGYTESGFDATGWSAGPAPLGFGSGAIATNIDVPPPTSNRPISAIFRHTFEVDDPAELTSLELTAIADDGVVLHLNGVEVGRANMPSGTVHAGSFPLVAPRTPAAMAEPVTFTVSPTLLQAGTNVVAASTHLGWRNTPDISFDLGLEALRGSPDITPPPAPAPQATLVDPTTVELAWQPVVDDEGELTAHRVTRDGVEIAFLSGSATTFTDAGLAGDTTYTYGVSAIDFAGNESTPGTVTVATAPDPTVLEWGSTWRWRYETQAPPAGWRGPGFDDTTWNTGAGLLGFGSSQVTTDISGPSPRPLAAYFRTTFEMGDPVADLELTTIADDGVVVYVNGVEVGRSNLPAGEPTHEGFWSLNSPRTNAALAAPVTFTVPAALLQPGTNTVAAQVQLGYRNTPDVGFDARIVTVGG